MSGFPRDAIKKTMLLCEHKDVSDITLEILEELWNEAMPKRLSVEDFEAACKASFTTADAKRTREYRQAIMDKFNKRLFGE
jgi:hypothetical protein